MSPINNKPYHVTTKCAPWEQNMPIIVTWGLFYCYGEWFVAVGCIFLLWWLLRLNRNCLVCQLLGKKLVLVDRPRKGNYKKDFSLSLFLRVHPKRLWQLRLVSLSHEHPKWDKNHWFMPLKETMNLPVLFIWESPSPPEIRQGKNFCFSIRQRKYPSIHSLDIGNESPCLSK